MAKRVCLLTGNETNCTDSCYLCGCGGEVALNDFYVPIYNIQRVCDIVKNMANVSDEGEEIAEYIRNELEKMTVCIENKAADVQPLSVVAEHIKQRLYETALNEPDTVASDVIADMAERINFWIDELKVGDTND